MSQHSMSVANGSGAAVRADLNNALQALASVSKGPAAPTTPYAGQLWLEDDNPSSTVWTLKQYDGSDWIRIWQVDATNNAITVFTAAGTAAAPAVTFDGDPDTGLYRDAANVLGIAANGAKVAEFSSIGLAVTGQSNATTASNNVTLATLTKTSSTAMTSTDTGMLVLTSASAATDSVGVRFQASGVHVYAGIKKGGNTWVVRTDVSGTPVEAISVSSAGVVDAPKLKQGLVAAVSFDGTAGVAVNGSAYGVSTPTRSAAGTYAVAFSSALSSANYIVSVTVGPYGNRRVGITSKATTGFTILTTDSAGNAEDQSVIDVVVFGPF